MESFGILGFQKVTGHALQGSDLIYAPFITLEWQHGMTLRWTDDSPLDLGNQNDIIRAIARITNRPRPDAEAWLLFLSEQA